MLAGVGAAPVRPVQLVQVDVVCLQALQAAVNGGGDRGAVEHRRAAADPLHLPRWAGHLGGNIKFLPAPLPPGFSNTSAHAWLIGQESFKHCS